MPTEKQLKYWESKKGKSSWNKGKKLSATHVKNLISSHKSKPSSFLGRKHTKKSKMKNRLAHLGEKSSLWKGGTSKLTALIRGSFQYRLWRSDVYTRDNFTCQECFTKSGCGRTVVLNADHIKSLAEIKEQYSIKTMEEALNCEELWNINNGKTLCIDCHKKTSTYAGRNRRKTLDTNTNT